MRFHIALATLASLVALPAILIAQNAAPTTTSQQTSAQGNAQKIAAKNKKLLSKAKAAKQPAAPAKELFGAVKGPAPLAARSIGF